MYKIILTIILEQSSTSFSFQPRLKAPCSNISDQRPQLSKKKLLLVIQCSFIAKFEIKMLIVYLEI